MKQQRRFESFKIADLFKIMSSQNSNPFSKNEQTNVGFSADDLAQIFNYPAIGELFSGTDTKKLDDFTARLNQIRNDLERIIRYGNRAEADSAAKASRSIEITKEFVLKLQKLREAEK